MISDQLRHLAHNIRVRNGDLSEAAICERAAERLRQLEEIARDFTALQQAITGGRGISAIQEACRLRRMDDDHEFDAMMAENYG